MRPWLAPLAALVLTACDSGAPRPALLDSRPPPGLAPRFLPPEGWAWGAIQPIDGPELRYGVTAPAGAGRRGQVLILVDSQEPAEAWFETAADLTRAGYVVWTFEWAGFGGSGRLIAPYDMVHARSADTGPQAVTALVAQVIRPDRDRPLSLIASGDAATMALATLQDDAPVAAAILSAPPLARSPPLKPWERLAVRLGLGRLPSPDWRPWSRTASAAVVSPGADPWRGRVTHGWRLANPDLRQGGASLGWRALQQGTPAAGLPQQTTARPILILSDQVEGDPARGACLADQGCRLVLQPGLGPAPHLTVDRVRNAWLEEVTAFLDAQVPAAGAAPHDPGPIE